ncbi:MAG: phosphatidylglycerol lysyltransferase domain-containing protein [Thermodesulfobacteriota bacterium]
MTPGSDWTPVSIAGREDYLRRLAACPAVTSDVSFGNIWGWREVYGLQWRFGRSHVWLRQTRPETVYWGPVGPWLDEDWEGCPVLARGGSFARAPEALARLWSQRLPGRVRLAESRGHWDYVYSVPELVELRGNRFHKKKNLLGQFLRSYRHRYHPMTPDCVEDVLQMQEEWCSWRDCESGDTLVSENEAIRRVLENWDNMPGMFGGVLEVEGRIVAYTVAERLDEKTLVIHFEKGHAEYKGVYQAINQLFLANAAGEYALVNREQDLDDPGLRKAKESYNPVAYLKKYEVQVAPAGDLPQGGRP